MLFLLRKRDLGSFILVTFSYSEYFGRVPEPMNISKNNGIVGLNLTRNGEIQDACVQE